MKTWVFRLSVALNLLVILAALGAWFNKDVLLRSFLKQMYDSKVSFFDSFPLAPDQVVMLGDSITDGGRWHEIFPAQSIVNRGIGGDTTTGALARLSSIAEARPSALFIKLGTNDLTHGPEREVSYRQYREIVVAVQTTSPATDIYVQSILPRGVQYREEVEAYNREIRKIAAELEITYIDLYPAFLAADGSIRDELTFDELHLTGEGYRLWQSLLQPYMAVYPSKKPFMPVNYSATEKVN